MQPYKCDPDYLKIKGLLSKANQEELFCGKLYNVRLQSEGSQVVVTFHTDAWYSGPGFELNYAFYDKNASPPGAPFTVQSTGTLQRTLHFVH